MELKNKYDSGGGEFYMEENGEKLAEMTYVFEGDTKFIIEHTEVFPAYEGKGLGKLLVAAAVDFARQKHFKIVPECRYARSVMLRTPEYSDVLA